MKLIFFKKEKKKDWRLNPFLLRKALGFTTSFITPSSAISDLHTANVMGRDSLCEAKEISSCALF